MFGFMKIILKNPMNIIAITERQKPANANINEVANFKNGLIELSVDVGSVTIDVFIVDYVSCVKSPYVLQALLSVSQPTVCVTCVWAGVDSA